MVEPRLSRSHGVREADGREWSASMRRIQSLIFCAAMTSLAGCGARTVLRAPDAPAPYDAGDVPSDRRDGTDVPDTITPDALACCRDELNTGFPPRDDCGGTTLAWEYVPSCSYPVGAIEMHTDASQAAILENAIDRPGRVLALASFGPRDTSGWARATFAMPVTLVAGQRYWIGHSPGRCSVTRGGRPPTYWGNFNGFTGPVWEGPFNDTSNIFTDRMVPVCP